MRCVGVCILTFIVLHYSNKHSCSSVVGGDRVMLLPGGHWCMVRDGAEGVRVEAGVVSGTKTRVVGTVVYDDQGELQYTFIGQDVLLT